MLTHSRRVGWLLAAGLLLGATTGHANGRFPRAERLIQDPANPNALMMAATFGILATSDRGKHWNYICEAGFSGQDGYTGDPLIDLTTNGTWVVGVQANLATSHDQGCNWTPTLAGVAGESVVDHTIVAASPHTLLALERLLTSGQAPTNRLMQSTDDGSTWHVVGVNVPLSTTYTIDVPPSDASRIYVTGTDAMGNGQLVVSHDSGATWTSRPIPNTNADTEIPYIAAVHPTNPDRIFVRTDTWVDDPLSGNTIGNDALLTSDDEGKTWTEQTRQYAKMFGFALSPDASTVLVGYGDPEEGAGRIVDNTVTGLYESPTTTYKWTTLFSTPSSVDCLRWTATGVYMCTKPDEDHDVELVFATTAEALAGTPTVLLRRSDVTAPISCCNGSTSSACVAMWTDTSCNTFMTCPEGGSLPPPPVCEAGATNAGTSGTSTTSGTSAGTGATGTTSAGTGVGSTGASSTTSGSPAPAPASSGGCSIVNAQKRSVGSTAPWAMLAGALVAYRRRRSRRRSRGGASKSR